MARGRLLKRGATQRSAGSGQRETDAKAEAGDTQRGGCGDKAGGGVEEGARVAYSIQHTPPHAACQVEREKERKRKRGRTRERREREESEERERRERREGHTTLEKPQQMPKTKANVRVSRDWGRGEGGQHQVRSTRRSV